MAARVRIGTSGFHYRHWRGVFYPEDLRSADWLAFYAREFDTVELNATFYRLPTEAAVARWHDQVPRGFEFAAKGSRFLTHNKKLTDTATGLERYFARVSRLGEALGPILWQLPPRWKADTSRLAAFLAALPRDRRHAFEFRDPSWFVPAVYRLLERHGAALCAYHIGERETPLLLTADFGYLRMHGPAGAYQGSYGAAGLERWAAVVTGWAGLVRAVYVFFNNDAGGCAVRDARTLRAFTTRAPLPG